MNISKEGIALIKRWEGFREKAYKDIVGVWTIGYGTTAIGDRKVVPTDVVDKEEAEQLLIHYVEEHIAPELNKLKLTQNQFDALCSFCYNLGMQKFNISTLRKKIEAGLYKDAAQQFLRWDLAGGRHVEGLAKRRADEARLFSLN